VKEILVLNGQQKIRVRSAMHGFREHGYTARPAGSPETAMRMIERDGASFAYAIASGESKDWIPVRDALAAHGIRTLILDLGYMRRATGPADPTGYNQAGWDRLCNPPAVAPDGTRLASLGIRAAPNIDIEQGQPMLVCAQVPHDTQHHLDQPTLTGWLCRTARESFPSLPMVWRSHPKHPMPTPAGMTAQDPRFVPLADALRSVSGVITYNSTAGVEAIIAGVPVYCHASAHYAAVATAARAERQAYLERLAWGQWTCDELASGEAIAFLLNA
jgi:hypothetical protein